MSSRSNSESDLEIKTIPFKKGEKKIPSSSMTDILNEPKKLTTREMINDALEELKSRKGVSYQAIKKYLVEKYQVDIEKMNIYIKKSLKSGVENGTIIQTKGIGASGSFKLAPTKPKTGKKIEKPIKKKEISKTTDKVEKIKQKDKIKIDKKKIENKSAMKDKTDGSKPKKVKISKEAVANATKQEMKMAKKPKNVSKSNKSTKQTPAKRKATTKRRKSIGAIIKAPKMKPKAK